MPRKQTEGEFIRDYLDDHGHAYVGELHRAYKEFCEENDYKPPSYNSTRRYVWMLRQCGLIELSHTEPSNNGNLVPRRYYKLVPGIDPDDSGWTDPQQELYG